MRLAAAVALMALSLAALAAPKAELWSRWTPSTQAKVGIDHGAWNDFLSRNVRAGSDGLNRLAYGKVSKADRKALDAYLERMQAVPILGFNRAEQRAYWINLYNAATVKVVLDHYPVESILKIGISPGLFAKGPWKKKLLKVDGEPLSLDDIEHRILRPIWKDPRTHYAVNCASVGCPNLQPRAYTSGNLEELLDRGAREYVNHPRGAHIEGGRLTVSSIYVWFGSDFGGNDAAVIAHLVKYAEPALAKRLRGVTRIADDAYDWTLNDAK
jgi:peptidyl-tRNA hydrolase